MSDLSPDSIEFIKQLFSVPLDKLLSDAIISNHIDFFNKIMQFNSHFDINKLDENVIGLIVRYGRSDMLKMCINAGFNVKDSNLLENLFYCTIDEKHIECLKLLITNGIDVNKIKDWKVNYEIISFIKELMESSYVKKEYTEPPESIVTPTFEEYVKFALQNTGKSINTIMCDLIDANDIKMFNGILALNLDFYVIENDKSIVMHAAHVGRPHMVRALIKKGVHIKPNKDINIFHQMCPLAYIFFLNNDNFNQDHLECVKILIEFGSDIEVLLECRGTLTYHLIKCMKELIESKKILRIKSLCSNKENCKIIKLGADAEIGFYEGGILKTGRLDHKNLEIEICHNIYQLPVGAIVDGGTLTMPKMCQFVEEKIYDGQRYWDLKKCC